MTTAKSFIRITDNLYIEASNHYISFYLTFEKNVLVLSREITNNSHQMSWVININLIGL